MTLVAIHSRGCSRLHRSVRTVFKAASNYDLVFLVVLMCIMDYSGTLVLSYFNDSYCLVSVLVAIYSSEIQSFMSGDLHSASLVVYL